MPDRILRTRLDELQAERRALLERERELQQQCEELEAQIRAIRESVKPIPETAPLVSAETI